MHLILAAALIAAPAAQADRFCSDIGRLIPAAKEKPPFTSLRTEGFGPLLLERPCLPNGRGYYCKQVMLPPDVTEKSMALRIADCLPGARIAIERAGPWKPARTMVRGAGLVFAIEETGDDRAHVGRMIWIEIGAEGYPLPGD